MFERFTEKSIKVITASQEEAILAQYPKIYPEHILAGIVKEGSNIPARFLRASGVQIEELRNKLNEIPGKKTAGDVNSKNLQFGTVTKKILQAVSDSTKVQGIGYINPEHIFLALLNEKNSNVKNILEDLDVNIERISTSIRKMAEKKAKVSIHPEEHKKPHNLDLKHYAIPSIFKEPDSVKLMETAKSHLENTNYEILGTEQILLSMLECKDSPVAEILENAGLNKSSFYEKLSLLHSRELEFTEECQFTPSAFSAITSAYEQAKELGFANIKPEHILLGVLKEKKGIAYKILKDLEISPETIADKILKPIEKQKPVTLTIIKLAKEEARAMGQTIVGTEQLLLGVLGEGSGIGARVLHELGITIKDTRIEIEKLLGYSDRYFEKDLAFTPRAKKLIEIAWSKAKKYNSTKIESEHLLLGIIKTHDCMAMKVLENLGVDMLEIKQGILREIRKQHH
ncbi:MAG: Clp protease N-terminal domain-containing protein [bacterium]